MPALSATHFCYLEIFSVYIVIVFPATVQQQRMNENVETCAHFMSGLIKMAACHSEATAGNVRDLIQALVVST